MSPLRQRMIHNLQLRGYSDRTVEAYTRAVAHLARFHHASPDTLTEEQVRQYLIHLTTVQQVARGTHTIALYGIKFFYAQTLAARGPGSTSPGPTGRRSPVVLSRDEVWTILEGLDRRSLRAPVARGRPLSTHHHRLPVVALSVRC